MNIFRMMVLLLGSLLVVSCNTGAVTEPAKTNDAAPEVAKADNGDEAEGDLASENFDLLAVGDLLNQASDGEEFERLLNKDQGFNNLDLNDDGYVDYVSVEEFENRTDDQRGFTLLSRFGPNDVQEIASIVFGRDRPDRLGSMLYVSGNEQIYGNNYGYEGNWLDKSLNIAKWVFGSRDTYYRSPYYYDNYPDYYDPYRVVNNADYKKRVYKYQENPAMIKITTPFEKIKIKSRYPGRSYRRVHARLLNPTEEQRKYFKEERGKPWKNNDKDDNGQGSKDKNKGNGNGKGKGQDNPSDKPGKPDVDKKPGKGNNKGSGNPGGKKNDDKKVGNPGKGPKDNGGGKEKGGDHSDH